MYNDFVKEPKDFEKNNVLYQYPINQDKLIIGKFCSIACGAKFIFNSANHTLSSLSTYPFPIFFEEWGLDVKDITKAWDNKGDILIDWIPIFEDKQIDYNIDIPEQPFRVKLDTDGYMRILNNLIQNVISHSHADKIEIILSKQEKNMQIRLADNGIGIEKEDLKHIFERLYKCDKGRSEKGSGLGLSIAHQLVEKMNGTITANSIQGKGTEFTLLFPLAK